MNREVMYDVSIFIITDDNEYIEYTEYDRHDKNMASFVCLTNDALNRDYSDNNSICIYKQWKTIIKDTATRLNTRIDYKTDNRRCISTRWWINEIRLLNNEIRGNDRHTCLNYEFDDDFYLLCDYVDGMATCLNMMSNVVPSIIKEKDVVSFIPAIMLAYHTCVDFRGCCHHGYLPAIGQLIYINRNIMDINTAMTSSGGTLFPVDKCNHEGDEQYLYSGWWSSTDFNLERHLDQYTHACLIAEGYKAIESKNSYNIVLPLFAL